MKLRLKKLGIESGGVLVVVLNARDADIRNIRPGDRLIISPASDGTNEAVGIVDVTSKNDFVGPGEIGLFAEVLQKIGVKDDGIPLKVKLTDKPASFQFIMQKVANKELTEHEIEEIVSDATKGRLTQLELGALIVGIEINGLTDEEIPNFTRAIANSGHVHSFNEPVFDKHSTGGVPGNKVSLVIVPIVASAGLFIPKLATRAITSPSGTADSMEALARVDFTEEELQQILSETRACIAWGGGLSFTPADSVFIAVEKPLNLDPKGVIIASILSKKLAMGVNRMVLDIPCGAGTKFPTLADGKKFALQFKDVAEQVGITAECALTLANQPVGHAVGPALEAQEALHLLQDFSAGPDSLINKSCELAGILLEMSGLAIPGGGKDMAIDILSSGKAYEKMREIIGAQQGNPDISWKDLPVGQYQQEIFSAITGHITNVDNKSVNEIAKIAGCPKNKGAGIVLDKKVGAHVDKGELLCTIYAESSGKLELAVKYHNAHPPQILGGMVLERV
ncbi:MAG TPA: AMP phosphorylase [Candidatus Lokiarchaeia archaeon]|nr:AMP phosphorylase [Candidatus Lokiarchaeia archaeon]